MHPLQELLNRYLISEVIFIVITAVIQLVGRKALCPKMGSVLSVE